MSKAKALSSAPSLPLKKFSNPEYIEATVGAFPGLAQRQFWSTDLSLGTSSSFFFAFDHIHALNWPDNPGHGK